MSERERVGWKSQIADCSLTRDERSRGMAHLRIIRSLTCINIKLYDHYERH